MNKCITKLKTALVILVLLSLFSIVGAQDDVTTIRFMDWKLSEEAPLEVLETLIAQFEAENPDLKVELIPAQWEQRIQQLLTQVQADTAPDLVRLNAPDFGQLNDLLQPVGPYLEELGIYDDIFSQLPERYVQDNLVFDGEVYGVPIDIGGDGLMYNKRMFEEAGLDPNAPPETLEEFVEYAKILTNPPDQYGYCMFGAKSGSTARRWYRWFWDNDTEMVARDFSEAMLNSSEAIEAITWYSNLALEHDVVPPGVVNADFEAVITAFAQERCAMHQGGANNAGLADDRNPGIIDHLALAPMPANGAAVAGGTTLGIPYNAENPEAAARLMAFLASKEAGIEWSLASSHTPARADALADDRIASDPFLSYSPPDPRPAYQHPRWGEIEDTLFDAIQAILLEDKTVEQALNDAAEEINEILSED